MSYVDGRERERFRAPLERTALEDSRRLHPERRAADPRCSDGLELRGHASDRSSRPDSACHAYHKQTQESDFAHEAA